ncbi:MAG: site-specific integrase [Nitrososphaerales archaeon]
MQETIITTQKRRPESLITKYLSNPDVKRWFDNLSRGSKLTAIQRLYKLTSFCRDHEITPINLIELARKDKLIISDLIQDHIAAMEEAKKAPSYIRSVYTAVKSWLGYFDIELHRRIKVANADVAVTLENERVPVCEEIFEIFSRAPLREATTISLMAKAGLRPETLGNYDAMDGLTIKDLPELVIQQGVAKFLRYPPMIIVRKTISKARHQYFTFITTQGAKRLLAYLNDRLLSGEVITPNTPIIAPDHRHHYGRLGNDGKAFLTTKQICRRIREVIRPRFQFRPYVFRSYFDTQLLLAESRGKIAHDFRVFFMGHKGSIEAKYTTNKGILPQSLINEMREAFKRSEEFLDLEVINKDPLEKQREEIRANIEKLTPEQLGKVQEMLRLLGICKPSPSKE